MSAVWFGLAQRVRLDATSPTQSDRSTAVGMTRFGDFTLIEDLGKSAVADRYKATHATQGGPFFLKVYTRLDAALHEDLIHRCRVLVTRQHPNLARHLGHGFIDGLPFVVGPYLDGMSLADLASSLVDRRVNLSLDIVFLLLGDLAKAVGALQTMRTTDSPGGIGHGAVAIDHVRVGIDGEIWLTGNTTPRGEGPGRPAEARWDIPGVGALIYDLVPLMRGGAARPPLPLPLDRIVRRALGIGAETKPLAPTDFADGLVEVARSLEVRFDRAPFAELIRRTARVVEKKLADGPPRPAPTPPRKVVAGMHPTPADAIPSLSPVDALPTLQPLRHAVAGTSSPGRQAPRVSDIELTPIHGPVASPMGVKPPSPMLEDDTAGSSRHQPIELPKITSSERAAILGPSGPSFTGNAHGMRQTSAVGVPPAPASSTGAPGPAAHTAFAGVAPVPAVRAGAPGEPRVAPWSGLANAFTSNPPSVSPPPFTDGQPPTVDAASSGRLQSVPVASMQPARPLPDVDMQTVAPARHGLPSAGKKPLLADPPDATRPTIPVPVDRVAEPIVGRGLPREVTHPQIRAARIDVARRNRSLQAVLRRNLIDEKVLASALEEYATRGGRVLEILAARRAIDDVVIADVLAQDAERPRLSDDALRAHMPPAALLRRIPHTYLLARRVLPLAFEHGVLSIAVADPYDTGSVDELRNLLGATRVESFVATRPAITAATIACVRALGLAGEPLSHGSGPRALLCMADDALATRLGAQLVQEGMRVEHVTQGDSARHIVLTRPPDVLLCSHDLPGTSVTELLLATRAQEATAQLPFFIFGPRSDDALAARLLDLGADDYFGEPAKDHIVLAKVRRATSKVRVSQPPTPGDIRPSRAQVPSTAPPWARVMPPAADPAQAAAHVASTPVLGIAQDPFAGLPSIIGDALDELPDMPDFDASPAPGIEPAVPTGVMGTLRQMPLTELVQSLEMGRKTARMDVVPVHGDKGMVAFIAGQLRYAECGTLRAEEAFYRLVRYTDGFFRIHYGTDPPAINIEAPTTFVLLEAMRRLDEERARGA